MRLSTADAHFFLNRLGFGGTPGDIEKLVGRSPEEAFRKVNVSSQPPVPPPDLHEIAEAEQQFIRELTPSFRRRRKRRRSARSLRNDPSFRRRIRQLRHLNRKGLRELAAWWFQQMLASPNPILEKMTLFWHNHFTTSFRDVRRARFIAQQHELLRRHAFGKFRDFLLAISQDAAMLEYLDNAQNRREHPNENYARELLELFTLGEGYYTDEDVKQAARAFTGWTHDPFGNFIFRIAWHDSGIKTFLGRKGRFNGDDIIHIILEQPQTARFLVTKLWRHFIHPDPDPRTVEPFARYFRETDYHLGKLVTTLFSSEAFYHPGNRGTLIKSPIDFIIGTLRKMHITFPAPERLWDIAGIMGQRLFLHPNVRGWPGGRKWLSTSTLTLRYAFLRMLITGEIPNLGRQNSRQQRVLRRFDRPLYDPTRVVPEEWLDAPTQATDFLIEYFIPYGMAAERREVIQTYAQTCYRETRHPVPALRRVTYLICSLPEYQLL